MEFRNSRAGSSSCSSFRADTYTASTPASRLISLDIFRFWACWMATWSFSMATWAPIPRTFRYESPKVTPPTRTKARKSATSSTLAALTFLLRDSTRERGRRSSFTFIVNPSPPIRWPLPNRCFRRRVPRCPRSPTHSSSASSVPSQPRGPPAACCPSRTHPQA